MLRIAFLLRLGRWSWRCHLRTGHFLWFWQSRGRQLLGLLRDDVTLRDGVQAGAGAVGGGKSGGGVEGGAGDFLQTWNVKSCSVHHVTARSLQMLQTNPSPRRPSSPAQGVSQTRSWRCCPCCRGCSAPGRCRMVQSKLRDSPLAH